MWNPDMYHGWGKTANYFEGWYFKLVNADQSQVLALIPGISLGDHPHAFIQVLNGTKGEPAYHSFDAEAFQPSDQQFEVLIGSNFFSGTGVRLDLEGLRGQLSFQQTTPWPKMLAAPGIMGWYGFVPMECYHGVVSLHHKLSGYLELNGKKISFDGGIGYVEKDWGRSFPSSWIWTQSNHLEGEGKACIMASVARIPWLGTHFIGYIVGFYWRGRLYKFATYTGAKMKASLDGDYVHVAFKDRRYRLEISGKQGVAGTLRSPLSGEMTGKVNESMQAELAIRFFDRNELILETNASSCGLEVAGPVEELLTDQWRR